MTKRSPEKEFDHVLHMVKAHDKITIERDRHHYIVLIEDGNSAGPVKARARSPLTALKHCQNLCHDLKKLRDGF